MPSPITTSGFSVGVLPRTDFADPRLLAPNYADILPSVGRGLALYSQLQEERERPLRARLAQLQLQEAEGRAQLAPLERKRRMVELAQPIERVTGAGIEAVNRFPTDIQVSEGGVTFDNTPAGEDIFATEIVESIDPLTGAVTTGTRRTRPISTMEQIENQRSLMEDREARALAAEERLRIQEAANQAKADNDRLRAEASMMRAQQLASNPQVGYVDVKRDDGRTVRQYFSKADPTRIIHEVDRGMLMSFGDALMASAFGGAIPATTTGGAQPNAYEAERQRLLGGGTPAATVITVSTQEQYDALAPGAEYIDSETGRRARKPRK